MRINRISSVVSAATGLILIGFVLWAMRLMTTSPDARREAFFRAAKATGAALEVIDLHADERIEIGYIDLGHQRLCGRTYVITGGREKTLFCIDRAIGLGSSGFELGAQRKTVSAPLSPVQQRGVGLMLRYLRDRNWSRELWYRTFEITYRKADAIVGTECLIDYAPFLHPFQEEYDELPPELRAKWSPEDWRTMVETSKAIESLTAVFETG